MDIKLQKFSFTAECHADIIGFITKFDVEFLSYKMKTPFNEVESCDFKFKAYLSKEEVIAMMQDLPGSQRMIQTLIGSDVYP